MRGVSMTTSASMIVRDHRAAVSMSPCRFTSTSKTDVPRGISVTSSVDSSLFNRRYNDEDVTPLWHTPNGHGSVALGLAVVGPLWRSVGRCAPLCVCSACLLANQHIDKQVSWSTQVSPNVRPCYAAFVLRAVPTPVSIYTQYIYIPGAYIYVPMYNVCMFSAVTYT